MAFYLDLRDIVGRTFGRLTVLRLVDGIEPIRRQFVSKYLLMKTPYVVSCACGNTVYSMTRGRLLAGTSQSCGCQSKCGAAGATKVRETNDRKLAERVDALARNQQ